MQTNLNRWVYLMKYRIMTISLVITVGLFLFTFLELRHSKQDLEIANKNNEILSATLEKMEAQIKDLQAKNETFKEMFSSKITNTENKVQTANAHLGDKKNENSDIERTNEAEASDAKEYVSEAQRKMIRQMTERQYQGLIKDLGIEGDQKEVLLSAVGSLGTKESAFNLKFFDEKVSNEELYEEQAQIYDDFIKELQNSFDEQSIEKIVKHKHDNRFKLAMNMYNTYLSELKINDQERKNIEDIFGEHLRSNTDPAIGSYTREYIQDVRTRYKGMTLGSPEFTQTTIDLLEEKNNALLKNLEKVASPETFEQIKAKIDSSTQMLKAASNS